jgi:hypothetical protein
LAARTDSPATVCRRTPVLWSALQSIFFALALAGAGATTAPAEAESVGAGSPETSTSRPADFRFDLNALELNVYGLAYHPDRERVHHDNLDNQFNPGLGLHYELRNTERGVTFAEAGAYYDSGRSWAKFLSLGYQFKLGENWRIGGALAAMNSRTYNDGVGFVGMFPLVTYDMGPVKLNAVYFPKVANYNEVEAYGFYITIPLGRWLGDLQKR